LASNQLYAICPPLLIGTFVWLANNIPNRCHNLKNGEVWRLGFLDGLVVISIVCLTLFVCGRQGTPEYKAKATHKEEVLAYARKTSGIELATQQEDMGMWDIVSHLYNGGKRSALPILFFRAKSPDGKLERWIIWNSITCSSVDHFPKPGATIRVWRQIITAGPDWQISSGSTQVIYTSYGCTPK